ncbi:MAG: hypothetical protein IPK99_11735 [Flavobacteriales bacterium]|nr:hypothetical protein [Flavobacteriales bacterium]
MPQPKRPILAAGFGAMGFWALRGKGSAQKQVHALSAEGDSLRAELERSSLARFQAERQKEFAETYLDNLMKGNEELKRVYDAEKAASNEAIAQAVEAKKQTRAKEAALKNEQQARTEEKAQRDLADARADSITVEQQRTNEANRRLQASKLAQNSMAVKGAPQPRALMALHALRTMERAGGDVHKDELIRALQGSLDELERAAPPGADRLGSGPRALRMHGAELWALGNDGKLLGIDPAGWSKHVVADASAHAGASGGRAFLGQGVLLLTDIAHTITICSTKDGAVIASAQKTPHAEDITAMAAFADGTALVSGDREGNLVVWAVEGKTLRMVQQHKAGGTVRALVLEPRNDRILGVHGTEKISILSKDGSLTTATLSDAARAHSIAPGSPGEVCIGTHSGTVVALDVTSRSTRTRFAGNGQRVEVLAVGPGGRIALVDAVRTLSVVDPEGTTSPMHLPLTGIPNVLAFGNTDVLYLGSEDRTVRRVLISTKGMAQRICTLVGRELTATEWDQYIGEGTPEPACEN